EVRLGGGGGERARRLVRGRLLERLLDQVRERLLADLLPEHPLEHGSWRLPGTEATQPRGLAQPLEHPIDLGADRGGIDLDLETLLDRRDVLNRQLLELHRCVRVLAHSARGGTRPPTVARELLSPVRLPVPPLSRRCHPHRAGFLPYRLGSPMTRESALRIPVRRRL